MKSPRFSHHDRFWIWYVLIILGIYIVGALVWRSHSPTLIGNTVSEFLPLLNIAMVT